VKITTPEAPSSERPPVRWWPAAAILALLALAIFYFRAVREDSQQWRNVYTMETCVVCFALSLVWVLFLSRLRWKVRLLWSGSAIGIIGLAAATVRIHGVTGDLVPIFKFPWSRPPSAPASTSVDQTTEGRPSPIDATAPRPTAGFPQFLGPLRDATLPGARSWRGTGLRARQGNSGASGSERDGPASPSRAIGR